jgi:curli biogenesis system outer membrane secretion channel CsgG
MSRPQVEVFLPARRYLGMTPRAAALPLIVPAGSGIIAAGSDGGMEEAMQKVVRCVTVALVVALVPVQAAAQGKIRIAIWDFENNSQGSYWFTNELGKAARNQIDTAIAEDKTLSEKFSVVEREKLALVMKEQGLSSAGAVDPQSAAKIGRLLGVKYIVTGAVDAFTMNKTSGGIGKFGVAGNVVNAQASVSMRFIDTTTAERVVSLSGEGGVKKGGGFVKGASLSRDAEFGIASEALQKASVAVVAKLVSGGYLAKIGPGTGPASGLEGKIAKVDGKNAWLNIGSSAGVKVGDKFVVFSAGEAIIDPDTGQALGASEKQTATGEVTEVAERFAVITFSGVAKVKDTARKKQ